VLRFVEVLDMRIRRLMDDFGWNVNKKYELTSPEEGREEILYCGGRNEERTGTVPTHISQMYATVI
jgi:hypothetical protein